MPNTPPVAAVVAHPLSLANIEKVDIALNFFSSLLDDAAFQLQRTYNQRA